MSREGFIGVDGGGTKTHFILIDRAGEVLAEHTGGTTYHLQVGIEGVKQALAEGLSAVTQSASGAIDRVAHAFIGLPAFGEDAAVDPVLQELPAAILGHRRYTCGNDMICGWAGSLGGADGINIVAGTGSIGYGERQGRAARAGGWGEVFSDEGSGYWLAIQGLNAFSRASDGRSDKGLLYQSFRTYLGLADDIDVCSRIMGPDAMSRQEIAALSPLVTEAALAGDLAALDICNRAGAELAAIADAIRKASGFLPDEDVLVSYSGGVLENSSTILASFRQNLDRSFGRYKLCTPKFSPAYGAALYAMRCPAAVAT